MKICPKLAYIQVNILLLSVKGPQWYFNEICAGSISELHIENSLSGIDLQRVGKIPINSIEGLSEKMGPCAICFLKWLLKKIGPWLYSIDPYAYASNKEIFCTARKILFREVWNVIAVKKV